MRSGFNKTYFSRCLFHPCITTRFDKLNTLQYTSEIQIYNRIREKCKVVANHEDADLFIVPFWYGTAIVSGWGGQRPFKMKKHMGDFDNLRHLNDQTAHKHVYFCTVDSQFVIANNRTQKSVWFHIGDDYHTGAPNKKGYFLSQSIPVPFQLSQWVHSNIEISSHRPIFLYSNTNLKRHAGRSKLQMQISTENQKYGFRVVLNERMQNVDEASVLAQTSKFCLCPTGDSKGFTARFYFSLFHGCVPVWIDTYKRRLSFDDLALPFKSDLDWKRLMVRIEYGAQILSQLKDVVVDYEYIRLSVDKLRYDRNASDLAVKELERISHIHSRQST